MTITAADEDCVFTAKGSIPMLQRKLKALPWREVPAYSVIVTGHDGRIRRALKRGPRSRIGLMFPARPGSAKSAGP